MDLADRALLLNPDEVQALLDAVTLQHTTHAIGGMQHCDRAVCRLAASVTQQGGDVGYDRGYDDGYAAHAAEVKHDACAAQS